MAGNNVLVLGHGTRAFLSVIRSLGRLGLTVHVAMCPRDDLALRSKYVHTRHEIGDKTWLEDMLALLKSVDFSLVLPCGDESMHPVQVHQAELSRYAPVYAYPSELYRIAFNKYESSGLAQRLGIPVPAQFELHPDTTSDDLLASLDLPLVLKPPSSIDSKDSRRRLEVIRVRTEAELRAQLPEFIAFGQGAVAQENFIGIGVGVEVLAQNGDVCVAFQHQRVHEPVEGGGSSYRRSVPLNPKLLAATEELMQALSYTGVAMVEYKLNLHTGEWVFIEINGRFWGSLPLAISAGVDFPAYLYRMLKGEPIEYPGSYNEKIHSRSLLDDYHWFANNLRADHDDPTQATVPLREVLAEFGNVLRGVERVDTWAWDDMAPALAELRVFSGRLAGKFADTAVRQLTPSFVLKRRAKAVRLAFAQARTVGFVCYGNICRSPFAEKYAATIYSDKSYWSSGFHDVDGRGTPVVGVGVAESMGIELSDWSSTRLTDQLVDETDLILIFDEKNSRMINERFPRAQHKVFFLADAIASSEREIEDPYGGAEKAFRQAYESIRQAVDKLGRAQKD